MSDKILFLANTESDGSLSPAGREALRAAVEMHRAVSGSTLVAGLFGGQTGPAAESAGRSHKVSSSVPRYICSHRDLGPP